MITMQNVTQVYPNGYKGLKNVNLKIEKGEFVSLIGESGAGKSTLLRLITCEERNFTGTVKVNTFNVGKLKKRELPHYRRKIGMIFQDFKLLAHKNAYENVAFALEMVGKPVSEIRDIVPKVLTLVGLKERMENFPHEMSGGEKQRVSLARALVHQPDIIIADEPTGNLDDETAWGIVQLLQRINNYGSTILLATHDQSIVNSLRRRVLTLHDGQIKSDRAIARYY